MNKAAETRKQHIEAREKRERELIKQNAIILSGLNEILQSESATPSEKLEAAKQAEELKKDYRVLRALNEI